MSSSERREIRRALESGRSEAEIVAELLDRGFAKAAVSLAVREVDHAMWLMAR